MAKIPTAQKYKQSLHVVKIKLQSFQSVSEIYSNELITLFLNGMLNYVLVLMKKKLKSPLSLPRSSFPHKVESKAWLSTQTSKRQRTCNLLYSRHWVSHSFLISHVFLLLLIRRYSLFTQVRSTTWSYLIVFLQWGPKPNLLLTESVTLPCLVPRADVILERGSCTKRVIQCGT